MKIKNIELPITDDIKKVEVEEDVIVRLYLNNLSGFKNYRRYIAEAKKIDGKNYKADCFYLESVAGKDNEGNWNISGWYLYYIPSHFESTDDLIFFGNLLEIDGEDNANDLQVEANNYFLEYVKQ